MVRGAGRTKKKKKLGLQAKKNRCTAPRFGLPASSSTRQNGGCVRSGCRGSVVRFGGVAHPLAHPLPPLPEVFFLALAALPSPPTKPPIQRSKSGCFEACFGAGWAGGGTCPATPSNPHPEARKQGVSIASIASIHHRPTTPPTNRR